MSKRKKADDEDGKALIVRLVALRRYTKLNQMQFAKMIGIPYKQWNHYERGYPLPREAAFILVRKFRITLDWLYFGKPASAVASSLLITLTQLIEDELRKPEPEFAAVIKQRPSRKTG